MNVLVVCDHFPPAFAPRMGYLCKYLRASGHEVDVVFERLEGDERYAYLCGYASKECGLRFYGKESSGWKRKWRWSTVMLRDLLGHYKDRQVCKTVFRWTNQEGRMYDVVLACSYRTFPLWAASRVAKKLGLPLVVDLRDIIEQYPDRSYLQHHLVKGKIGECVEEWQTKYLLRQRNRVLRRADAIVSVSPWHVDYLKRFNPAVHLVYNGYDPEIFYPAPQRDSVFRITYTGRIISFQIRDPEILFKAVALLKTKGIVSGKDFRLCWYVDKASQRMIEKLGIVEGVADLMEMHDFVAAAEVPEVLNRSSVLLQLANVATGNGPKGIMSTKVFEALAIGKPILLVPDDCSFLGRLVESSGMGLAAKTVEEVARFIEAEYGKWQKTGSTQREVNREIVGRFSRKEQAMSFLHIFEQVVESRGTVRK